MRSSPRQSRWVALLTNAARPDEGWSRMRCYSLKIAWISFAAVARVGFVRPSAHSLDAWSRSNPIWRNHRLNRKR